MAPVFLKVLQSVYHAVEPTDLLDVCQIINQIITYYLLRFYGPSERFSLKQRKEMRFTSMGMETQQQSMKL